MTDDGWRAFLADRATMTDDEIRASVADRYEAQDRLHSLAKAALFEGDPLQAGAELARMVLAGDLVLSRSCRRGRKPDVEGDFGIWLTWMRLRTECGLKSTAADQRLAKVLGKGETTIRDARKRIHVVPRRERSDDNDK